MEDRGEAPECREGGLCFISPYLSSRERNLLAGNPQPSPRPDERSRQTSHRFKRQNATPYCLTVLPS